MTIESDTVETWNVYGAHQLARRLELLELDRWEGPSQTPVPASKHSAT
ncbi:hypothetical protein AB0G64_35940 [Streptomyces longwoodensis]